MLLGTLLTACGGGDSPSVFEELLAKIPDTPETREWVLINDYALVREEFGIPLPDQTADRDRMVEYIIELVAETGLARGPFISGMGEIPSIHLDMAQYRAFDARNVDQTVEAGLRPGRLEVVQGRFDPDATGRALGTCDGCEPPQTVNYGGATYYSWGGDFKGNLSTRFAPPVFDRLGRGGRILVQDDYVYRALSHGGMEELIEVSLGDDDSLAELEDFKLLAEALSHLGAYTALLSDQTQRAEDFLPDAFSGEIRQQRISEIEKGGLLLRYSAFAIGAGADEDGRYGVLILIHDNADEARENARILENRINEGNSIITGEPWTEMIGRLDVNIDGRVLSATFSGEQARKIWLAWIVHGDTLIAHE